MGSLDFFATHPVFTHDDFVAAHGAAGGRNPQTAAKLLLHHVGAGRLVRVRRGVYAAVPAGVKAMDLQVDPYLLASKLAPGAVVAYHAALQFRGKTYSLWQRYHFLTRRRTTPLSFRGAEFLPVRAPSDRRARRQAGRGVVEEPYAGGMVRVTSLERTLVDVLEAPSLGGGWEEIWRSLEMVEFFDLDAVIGHALARSSALTVARVGLFLEQHREALMVEDGHLTALRRRAPAQPRYLGSDRETGRLVKPWNLVVPERILTRAWADVA